MKIAIVCFKYGVDISDPCCFPLGFMMISAVLKQKGYNVTVFNENLHSFSLNDLLKFDIVCMTGFEEFKSRIIETAAFCKEHGIKTVLGGALASFCPDEMLQHVDTVVIGEGEEVVEQALFTTGKIQGIPPDLDRMPRPDYEGFGIREYNSRHSVPYVGVLTSRGCPFSCKFCAQTCEFRVRRLADVFAEVDHYRAAYGAEMIVFNDNTLNTTKRRFLDVCAGMKQRGLAWSAAIRCDNFDEETAKAAKDSGAKYFVVGVESFRQSKLDQMNKCIRTGQIVSTLDLLHKYDLDYHGNILFGLPGETALDVVDELTAMPKGYKVFPVFVQGFVGTSLAGQDRITGAERQRLSGYFRQIVAAGQKYMYPELAHV